jgi:hypothetical protein
MTKKGKWIRRAVTPVIVGGLMAAAGTPTGENLGAQGRKRVTATRIFTGADGQTQAEEIEVPIKATGGTGGLGELSAPYKVTGLEFRRTPPNYFYDWHTAPRRQFVVTLSGRGEVELVGGKKIPLDPGHVLLAEDLTGKGHISRGVGTEDRISLFIHLAEPAR